MIKAITIDKPDLLIREIDKLNEDLRKTDYSIKLSQRVEEIKEVKNEH